MDWRLKTLNHFTIKLKQLLWFRIISLVCGVKKQGNGLLLERDPFPYSRGGLKEENGINHTPFRKEEKLLGTTLLEKALISD